jgi:uncharacterized protein YndB with AHSA1/START domain
MPDLRIEARFKQPIAAVFAALTRELGEERWLRPNESYHSGGMPQPGLRFGYRQARRMYSGQVLECLRPVSIVLIERYHGPAGLIVFTQRWRLTPSDALTHLRAQLRIEPNRFARFQLRFWSLHFRSRAMRTCRRVDQRLQADANHLSPKQACSHQGDSNQSDSMGHNTGNISIVSANTTSVSGKPILR